MRTFTNDTDEPVEIPYEDTAGVPGVVVVGPGGVVQVDDTDPASTDLVAAYAAALTEQE